MRKYLGLDVHRESTTVCVLSESGKRLDQQVFQTDSTVLIRFLKQLAGDLHLCIEEGEWAQWLYESLSEHVAELVVVRGRKRQGSKDDARDAYDLAERLRTGRVRPIFKSAGRFTKLRELKRTYRFLRGDLVRARNRFKSGFRRRGVSCADEVYGVAGRTERLAELPESCRAAVELLGREMDALTELKAEAQTAMVRESHRHRISRILESLPGLGPVRVAQLLAIVVTPNRFRAKRPFWAYSGLGVVMESSSDWVRVDGKWARAQVARTRGLNRNFHHELKEIFKGAALSAISARSNPFRQKYEELCAQGTKPNLARLTVARQLAATCLAMWKSGKEYDPSYR